jgi:hypothetical protein
MPTKRPGGKMSARSAKAARPKAASFDGPAQAQRAGARKARPATTVPEVTVLKAGGAKKATPPPPPAGTKVARAPAPLTVAIKTALQKAGVRLTKKDGDAIGSVYVKLTPRRLFV